MADNRFSSWKEDDLPKGALQTYVKQRLQREEAIDFMRKDFPQYAWNIRTLDKRLRHFEVYYKDDTVSVEDVKEAVKKEWKAQESYLNNRVFMSQNYRLIVAPRKFDVLKTNMLVLRTSNFRGATIRPIVPRHKHSIVFIVHH